MAIFQALFGMVSRSVGKILNTAFGWATVMLFGKVPQDKQIYLSIMSFGSVLWILVVLGIIFPSFGTFMLAFVPLPKWVNHNWIRVIMAVLAVIIPAIVGVLSLKVAGDLGQAKTAMDKVRVFLRGYPYTFGMALTLLMMTLFAPVLKVRTMMRRWTTEHVPIIVENQDYLDIVGRIEQALKARGWETRRTPASWMLRLPTRILTFLAHGTIKGLVAENLTTLEGKDLEVILHPSDMIVNGKETDVVHARAAIAEEVAFSKAYMTWDKEANKLEDRLREIWDGLKQKAGRDGSIARAWGKLQGVEQDLRKLKIPYDEWEILYREVLMVERAVLEPAAGVTDQPRTTTEKARGAGAPHPAMVGPQGQHAPDGHMPIPKLAAAATLAALAWIGYRKGNEEAGRKAA